MPEPQVVTIGPSRSTPARPKAAFSSAAGRRPPGPFISSGIAAAVTALALARLGHWHAAVYDGSWTEWGAHSETPVVTGS